jgi:rubrerythrin
MNRRGEDVDINKDHLRRELGELGRQHDAAMKGYTEALDRLVNENDLNAEQKDEFVLGGLNRRRFMTIGGVSIASAAIFAACGSSSKSTTPNPTTVPPTTPPTTTPPTTATAPAATTPPTTAPAGAAATQSDLTILRTASSLEVLAVDTYKTAIKSGLVTSSAVAAAAKDFMEQHAEHAAAFEAATKSAGGTPFTKPNPVVYSSFIAPALKKVKNQADVVALAYDLENAAAQTYVSTIGAFDNAAYNPVAASIAGVESRHMTVLASVLMSSKYPEYVASGFFTTTGAVKPGTGVS